MVQVAGVVTQPGRPKGRGKKQVPSPVEAAALERGLSRDAIMCPVSAREVTPITLDRLAPLYEYISTVTYL